MRALDEAETVQLLEAAEGTWLYTPILMAVTTGMRRGELLGLRWADVDLEAKVAFITQALSQTKLGRSFKSPKTNKARRSIALLDLTVDALRRHRGDQARQRLQAGPAYEDTDLIFVQSDGSPFRPDTVSKLFGRLARRAGLPGVRLHDLRHSHATQLLKQGVHPKIVSERLGHSTVSLTLDVYSHVLPGMQEDAAERIDAALRKAFSKALSVHTALPTRLGSAD